MPEIKEQVTGALVRARSELEAALSDLERMPAFDPSVVGFLAHALENFLDVTKATTEALLDSLTNRPDPRIRVWLEGLRHTTTLMAHTVSQLMNTAVATETKFRFEKVALSMLCERACTYFQRRAERKNIRVIYGFVGKTRWVWTDRVAVAAVLDNLLSNAVKYSPPGKSIWVQVRGEETGVVCSVQDEGSGLSREDQARLFQRGVPLTSVPTGGEPSAGFGLAVAKELMDQLQGTIWCESELHHGARFSFRLPRYREQDPRPQEHGR